MVEGILASKRIKVALLSPGAIGKTALTHFGTTFAKVMMRVVDLEYISETSGEYNGIRFNPIGSFDPSNYDVVHFQWGNNPLHLFQFSALLKIPRRKNRPLIVSTLHEAELGYLLGASNHALCYRWYFRLRNSGRTAATKGSDYECFSHYTVAAILQRSDCVIVHSEYARRRLINEHQLNPHQCTKIRVAHLGIDWEHYAAARSTEGFAEQTTEERKSVVFLYVGSLYSIKSIDKIIRAFHFVRHFGRQSDFHLVIVGSGAEHDDLRAMADALIPGQYTFAGAVPNVLPYYQLADVVVCPRASSRGEVSGSIPEACAAGKPIILPRMGGWDEYVDESTGLLVAADDELEYAQAILFCLNNPDDIKQRGANAQRFAKEYLSWQSQTQFFLSLYSEALHNRAHH
jgi:glycosyltransferase involved in cell wall biosynthesis